MTITVRHESNLSVPLRTATMHNSNIVQINIKGSSVVISRWKTIEVNGKIIKEKTTPPMRTYLTGTPFEVPDNEETPAAIRTIAAIPKINAAVIKKDPDLFPDDSGFNETAHHAR